MNVRGVIAIAAFALAAAFATAGCSQSADTPAWKTLPKPGALPMPDESGLAPVDDIKMWYAIFNKGGPNPVLLIHGGLVHADTWGNQVPVLAKTHEVIIADSRGPGRSTRSNKPFGYELMGERLSRTARLSEDRQGCARRLERWRHHRTRHRRAPSRASHHIVGVRREYDRHGSEG